MSHPMIPYWNWQRNSPAEEFFTIYFQVYKATGEDFLKIAGGELTT